MMILASTLAALALAATPVPGPAPRLDAWSVVGPGGGGTMRRPAVSPHDPKVVVLGCDMTGAYITRDGGQSWRMFNLGWVVDQFAFDPKDPAVIYAASQVLWRTEDGGATWAIVFPDPARNTVEHGWGDHADVTFTSDDPLYPSGQNTNVQAIVVDPSDNRRLFIAMSSTSPGPPGSHPASRTALLSSTDRGRTWTRLTELAAERVFALWVEPGASPVLRAAGETATYEGWGTAWQHFAPPASPLTSASYGRDPATGRTLLYATSALTAQGGGLHVSEDGGRTWRAATGDLARLGSATGEKGRDGEPLAAWGPAKGSQPALGPVAVSGGHGLTAYVGLRGLREKKDAPPFNGIARTTDGGRTWQVVHAEADGPSRNLEPSWIEARAQEDGHSIWFDAPYDIAVSPGAPDTAYATDLFRTYRTEDGGGSWGQVNSARRGEGWVSRGLDVTNAYGVHWDPFDHRRMFMSNTDVGLFRSEDGGATWQGATRGVPRHWRNTTYWIAFDPDVKDLVWGAFSGTHDLPRPKMWRRTDPATYKGGVGVSVDGGRTWTPSGTGLPESAVTHVLLDPASAPGHRTLYASAFGRGVYKSVDNGKTWTLKNAGITQVQPFAWRITRDGAGALYLVVARRSERGRIGDAGDGALYRSENGGDLWTPVALPAGTNGPNALTVDPSDPRRLYLSAWGVATSGDDTGGGIFLSTDRGTTWKNVLPAAQHVYDVTVDPRDAAVLYASGFDRAAWRSSDRGLTWSRLGGFNFKWGQRAIPDPEDPKLLYVTTFGGGVWHGPALGDPASREDRAPAGSAPAAPTDRREQIVEANVAGIHAFQVKLARAAGAGKSDPECWASPLTDGALDALVAHQAALLASDPAAVKAWMEGRASAFDPGKDLQPLLEAHLAASPRLPVNVFAASLAAHAPGKSRAEVRAVANLYQTVLEVERDGEVLQDIMHFDIALGLPVYVGYFGLPGGDEDFLATGRALEGQSCASPVGLSAAEWQIAGRKIWNWGEKHLHIRDATVVADELRREDDVKALLPALRALPPLRVAVIGHSFTMNLHWSSPSAFVPIATAVLARENPKVVVRQFEGGGLTSSRAETRFLADAVAWKPDVVLLVVLNRTDQDLESLGRIARALTAAGARVYSFDDLHDPDTADPARLQKEWDVSRAAGIHVALVSKTLADAPERPRFFALDKVHMTEPYHRIMAREWLKVLAGTATLREEK